jgi:hypothetical protein
LQGVTPPTEFHLTTGMDLLLNELAAASQ